MPEAVYDEHSMIAELETLRNDTNKTILTMLEKDGLLIQSIKEPTNEMCLTAIKQNPESLGYIKDQTVEMCIEALKLDHEAAQDIRYDSEQVYKKILDDETIHFHEYPKNPDFFV